MWIVIGLLFEIYFFLNIYFCIKEFLKTGNYINLYNISMKFVNVWELNSEEVRMFCEFDRKVMFSE